LYKYIWTIRQTIRLQYTQWQALLAGYNTQTHLHGVDDGLWDGAGGGAGREPLQRPNLLALTLEYPLQLQHTLNMLC